MALMKHHFHGVAEIRLHVFIYWTLETVEQSASHIGPFCLHGKECPARSGEKAGYGEEESLLPVPTFEPNSSFIVMVRTELYRFLVLFA